MCPNNIIVWFACKSCKCYFSKVPDFIEHKKEIHSTEFHKLSCIVFEERIDRDNEYSPSSTKSPTNKVQPIFAVIDPLEAQQTNEDGQGSSIQDDLGQIETESDPFLDIEANFADESEDAVFNNVSEINFDTNSPDLEHIEDFNTTETERVTERKSNRVRKPPTWKTNDGCIFPSTSESHGSISGSKDAASVSVNTANTTEQAQTTTENQNEIQNQINFPTTPALENLFKLVFQCKCCLKNFPSEPDLKAHLVTCGSVHQHGRRFCSLCNRKFQTVTSLRDHRFRRHGTEEEKAKLKKFLCHLCPKKFSVLMHLTNHMEFHKSPEDQLRPFQCHICGRSYVSKCSFTNHVKLHTDGRPWKCPRPNCGNTYKTSGNLQRHLMDTHSDLRPYKCPVENCGKTFNLQSSLRQHSETHSDERPYRCTVENCGKGYKTARELGRHQQSHSLLKPYKCTAVDCEQAFGVSSALTRHMQNVHKIKLNKSRIECWATKTNTYN